MSDIKLEPIDGFDLKVEPDHGEELVKIIKDQGKLFILVSVVIFVIFTIVRFAFNILEQRFYLFCIAADLLIFIIGILFLIFRRLVWCQEKYKQLFTKVFYITIYVYLVGLFSIGFGSFGCIRCIYGLVGSALSIPSLFVLIRIIMWLVKMKRIMKIQVKKPQKTYERVKIREDEIYVIDVDEKDNIEMEIKQ
jgi:hypothetical protein